MTEDLNEIESEKKQSKIYERVSLGEAEANKVAQWVKQVEEASKGFLQLSKADIVNFVIREQKPELSKGQVQQIRRDHYEPIRHIAWIGQQLKDALSRGDMETVTRLQLEIRGIELGSPQKSDASDFTIPKRKRARRNKTKKVEVGELDGLSLRESQGQILEG